MVEHHDWPGAAVAAAIVNAGGDIACGAGDFNVADYRKFAHWRVGNVAHGRCHRARLIGRDFPESRARNCVQKLKE